MIKALLITLLATIPIDAIWLMSMRGVYDKWLVNFERHVNWYAVILVYLAIPLGLFYFVISKHATSGISQKAIVDAFLYGVFTYAVYDLTNLATLKNWSIQMTIVDIIWGGVLCTLTTIVALFIISKM